MTTNTRTLAGPRQENTPQPSPLSRAGGNVQIPQLGLRVMRRRHLTEVLDWATRRRVTLVCAPAQAGKTVACAAWAQARSASRRIVWVALESDDDQAWFWAWVCSSLRRTAPPDVMDTLEGESAAGFPLRLAHTARLFTEPVVIVVDNIHKATDAALLQGLDLLIRHAPSSLRLVLSGRCAPRLQLARLRASGELAEVDAADIGSNAGISGTFSRLPRPVSQYGGSSCGAS
jgi:LuxR family transcriptional regulator, maltose regulon positive regulatory protein